MLFSSLEYFVFLGLVLLLYYVLNHRSQNLLLLVGSLFFYGYWDYRFLSLIVVTILVDFYAARALHRTPGRERRKLYLCASIAANLAILGYFKYFNFFLENVARLTRLFGLDTNIGVLQLILPVGISFYTFQSMSYTIDVYRRQTEPVDNLLDFALYITYFPKLIAGPIERARSLVPQIRSHRLVTTEMFASGCILILIGLFRKVVIADGLAQQIDPCFTSPTAHSTANLIKALYLFALQIYCDFAGYSDIARGTSRLFGIELRINFDHPYFSPTISDFWRRWHVSLSEWLRDYLFFPLCGNRHKHLRIARNFMITMLLAGLWHGAAWCFVVWGGLHGLYLIGNWLMVGRLRFLESLPLWSWKRVVGIFVTFHLVLLSLVFFRAPGLKTALIYFREVFALKGTADTVTLLSMVLIPWLLVLAVDIPQYLGGSHTVVFRWPKWARAAAVTAMLFLVLLGFGIHAPFIYFQF